MEPAPLHRTARLAIALAALGCSGPSNDTGGPALLVPVQGVVTLDGQPLSGAVVSFLPTDERGTMTIGETDDDGSYLVRYLGAPGTAPGPYKVGISYMETHEGRVMGLGPRSALSAPPGYETAAERLPAKYSDLGRSELKAEVTDRGGTFNFELEGPLLDVPPPEAVADPAAEASEAEPAEAPPAVVAPEPAAEGTDAETP